MSRADQSHRRRKNPLAAVFRAVGIILLIAIIAICVPLIVPKTMGYQLNTADSGSMEPAVPTGSLVFIKYVKPGDIETGDIIAFYYNNKVLIKRVIGLPGEWVNIDGSGNVYINGELLEEPYITDRPLGDCSITLPYQVPDGRYFVLGDHRSTSRDSRSTLVGPVSEEQIMGRVTLRIWPLNRIGFLQ